MNWESTFETWSTAPGQTEQQKCDNAVTGVTNAVKSSTSLSNRSVTVLAQGSYRNRTSVRGDSDVDVGVRCSDTFYYDLPDGKTSASFGITPASYSYSQFKDDVERALRSQFGDASVVRGNKAFDVHANTYRVDADVVACFEYRRYKQDGTYLEGTSFYTDQGIQIINWPQQNYDNGVWKNDQTARRFKALVRILKRLRYKMMDEHISAANLVPSYLVECLTWNVPIEGFGHNTLEQDVRWVLAHLCNNTRTDQECHEWGEINELKYLFRGSQPWTRANANLFLNSAWNYLGFS